MRQSLRIRSRRSTFSLSEQHDDQKGIWVRANAELPGDHGDQAPMGRRSPRLVTLCYLPLGGPIGTTLVPAPKGRSLRSGTRAFRLSKRVGSSMTL